MIDAIDKCLFCCILCRMKNDKYLFYFAGYGKGKSFDEDLVRGLASFIGAEAEQFTGHWVRPDTPPSRYYEILKPDNSLLQPGDPVRPRNLRHVPDTDWAVYRDWFERKIAEVARKEQLDWKNVYFAGRDQGAYVAMLMAYSTWMNPRGVISINGYYLDEPMFGRVRYPNTPIVWATDSEPSRLVTADYKMGDQLAKYDVPMTHIDLKDSSPRNLRAIAWAMDQQKMRRG